MRGDVDTRVPRRAHVRLGLGLLLAVTSVLGLLSACAPQPTQPGGGGPSAVCDGGPEDPSGGSVNATTYGAGFFNYATIYPACATTARGTVMYVHGGSYTSGSRFDAGWPPIQELRRHGWVVVSIDYALSPVAKWPDHVDDVRTAITWWRTNGAAQYSAPVWPLVGVGWSAGAQLVEWANLEDSGPHFDAAVSISGATYWPDRATSEAAVNLFGPVIIQDPALLVQASTLTHLDPADAPVLHVHARNDGVVSVNQAILLRDAIASGRGDPVRHQVVLDPDCGHSPACLTPELLDSYLASLPGF
ncbi:MAG: alpha/beta hydrolase [Microthrixaceae bacterium]